MADLHEQLQATLGDAFTIQRELGGGGMSRVFLAEEVALGRPIVLKVLPPEMAAAVNIERFRREIRLAASLQHPHIVALHSAGQAGDLLYYTMPYVDGESLRVKLAREREMPVGEAVRIMRDVAEALAYAHARGIVHRDIKPDNILIAGNHALVTDFGVAKAVSAATGSSLVTSIGVALGTPAYMAPEQAVADPHVDARADLYALGVVGYEMLCGRPLFVGMTPQQVLAAQVTTAPEPCTTLRPSIPPLLGALVMRCLSKDPETRVQRAEDLASELEAMATPSHGLATTAVSSVILSAGAAPARVSVLFAIAAVVVVAVAYGLMIRLGLPSWVVPAAVVLLAVGFPIMLLTAKREHERTVARTTETSLPATVGGSRLFTWRNALFGGGVAFGALIVLTAAYMAMRLLGIGPIGTLVASGKLRARQRVVLADFTNRSSDTTLGSALTEAFRVDLAQSPTVQLEAPAAIANTLALMQRPTVGELTPALARDVAERQGVSAVVTGEIDPLGAGYILSASVLSASDGSVLTAVRSTANSSTSLIPALDELSKALRERIGESLRSIRADEPLEAVTTGSLDALRKYTEGVRLMKVGEDAEAIPVLEDAVRIDTGFAMAYRRLAAVIRNSDGSPARAIAAATEAYAHRDRLPEYERDLATGSYNDIVMNDPPRAIQAYRLALTIAPNDPVALTNLGHMLNEEREYTAAESPLTRAIAEQGGVSAYYNLFVTQTAQAHYGDADSTIAHLTGSAGLGAAWFHAEFLSARHDYAAAERLVQTTLPRLSATSYDYAALEDLLSRVSLTQGRIARADSAARLSMASEEVRNSLNGYLRAVLWVAEIDLRLPDSGRAAHAVVAAALTRHPLDSMLAADRPYGDLVRVYVLMGQLDRARQTFTDFERDVPSALRVRSVDWQKAGGALAAGEGRAADAIATYHAMRQGGTCGECGDFEIAEVYRGSGQPDSAIAYYIKGIDTPDFDRLTDFDASNLAASYQHLGELYARQGDRAKAADYYERLLDLWRNADPAMQPIVRDARARLARLSLDH